MFRETIREAGLKRAVWPCAVLLEIDMFSIPVQATEGGSVGHETYALCDFQHPRGISPQNGRKFRGRRQIHHVAASDKLCPHLFGIE